MAVPTRVSASVAASIGSPVRRAGGIARGVMAAPAIRCAGEAGVVDAGVRAMFFLPLSGFSRSSLPGGFSRRFVTDSYTPGRGRRGSCRRCLVELQEDLFQGRFFG